MSSPNRSARYCCAHDDGKLAAEVGEAELVDLDHAVLADRAFPPGHRSGEHPVDVGVGLLGGPGNVAEHRGNRQVWFEVAFAIRWVSGVASVAGATVESPSDGAASCTFRGGRRTGVPWVI